MRFTTLCSKLAVILLLCAAAFAAPPAPTASYKATGLAPFHPQIINPGGGGSGTISSGTTNTLSKYTAATTLGNSLATDDGNLFSYNGAGGLTANVGAFSGTNGGIDGTEGTGAGLSAASNHDLLYPFATPHRWAMNNNNAGAVVVMGTSTTAATQGDLCIYAANGFDCSDSGVKFTAFRDNLTNTSGNIDWTPVDSTVFYWQDEFMGGAASNGAYAQNGWTIANITSCGLPGNPIAGVYPHIGIMENKPPATTDNGCYLESATVGAMDMTTNTNWDSKWVFDMNPFGGGITTNIGMYVGFLKPGDNAAPPTNGIYLRYETKAAANTSGQADTGFTAVCRSGGTDTLPSGTPTWTVTANAWRTIRIQSTVAGTVVFTLYDATGAVINNSASAATTSITSGCPTSALVPGTVIVARTTTAVDLYHDFFAMKVRGLGR